LAYLASNYVYHVGPLFRQHMTMVMFETLAVVTVAAVDFSADPSTASVGKRRRLLLATLCFLLAAGYTKQLAVATVGAVLIYLLMNMPRRVLAWAAGFAAVGGAIFLWLNAATSGQWWLNIITANVNDYIRAQFFGLLGQFIKLHGALLLPALLLAAYELYFDRLSVYTLWFGASLVNAVLAGKWGAGDSYYATTIAAMCLLAGLFTARSAACQWRLAPTLLTALERRIGSAARTFARGLAGWIGAAACGLFVLYGLAVVKMPLNLPGFRTAAQVFNITPHPQNKFDYFYDSAGWTMGYATIGHLPTGQDIANGWRIVEAAKADPRPILSEEAAFSFLSGKPVVSNPTQLKNLYDNGHLDPSKLVAMIEAQEFGLIIYRAGFYPEPVLAAVQRAYRATEIIPMNGYEYTLLVPR
jgi:hypothetical protein